MNLIPRPSPYPTGPALIPIRSKTSDNVLLRQEILRIDTSDSRFLAGETPPITPVNSEGGNENLYQSIVGINSAQHEASPPRTPKAMRLPGTPRSSRASSTSSMFPPEPQTSPSSVGLKSFKGALQGTFTVLRGSRPYGHGAWSVVRQGLYTRYSNPTSPEVIAVKQPISKQAVFVLTHEAAILSQLSHTPNIVPFYGFDAETASLLFPALPFTMELFVKESNTWIHSEENMSLSTMRCPVVKMRQWLFFSYRLCQGLIALREKGVVHGDIKLGNVLLREYNPSKNVARAEEIEALVFDKSNDKDLDIALYEPLIADFSSSHIIKEPSSTLSPEAINALTIGYCAPELLELFLPSISAPPLSTPPRTPKGTAPSSSIIGATPLPIPTFASDLYSLAITLLAAAIGSEPYAIKGATDARKGMYAKCGDPIAFARGDERGLRCGRGGVVASCLEGCFGKKAEGRTQVETLKDRVVEWVRVWSKEGRGNDRWGC